MNRLFSVLMLSMAMAIPLSANAEGYTGRLLEVYFGVSIPKDAPSVRIGYGESSTSVEMKSLVYTFTKQLSSQEVRENVGAMCRAYYDFLALGRKSMPLSYYGAVVVGVYDKVDGKLKGSVDLELISRNGQDPFRTGSPFPKATDCIQQLTTIIEKLNVHL